MQQLCGAGYTVGEYVGDSKGDTEGTEPEAGSPDTEPVVDDQHERNDEDDAIEEGSSKDANPLIFFYDCETTGFSIYTENITEIAAKVFLFHHLANQHSQVLSGWQGISLRKVKWIKLDNILDCITLTWFSDKSNWHIKSSVA